MELGELDVAEVIFVGELGVGVEEEPFAVPLDYGVVGGPALDGKEEVAAIVERAFGGVAGGVGEEVGVAGRVGEVVEAVAAEEPGGLEEAAVVVSAEEGLIVLVEDLQVSWGAGEVLHVWREAGYFGHEGRFGVLVEVGGGGWVEGSGWPVFELAAPDSAEVHEALAVGVGEDGWIDAEAAGDRFGVWVEGAEGGAGGGDADAEDALLVAGGEVEEVGSVAEGGVGCPGLFGGPGDVLEVEGDGADGDGVAGAVYLEDAVVVHGVLAALVVVRGVGGDVVGGVDVELAREDVGGWVGGVDGGDEGLGEVVAAVGGGGLVRGLRGEERGEEEGGEDVGAKDHGSPRYSAWVGLVRGLMRSIRRRCAMLLHKALHFTWIELSETDMSDSMNRRSFVLGAGPAVLAAAALTSHDLFAETGQVSTPAPTTPAAAAALPPANDRTVYFASDYPNISPEDHLRMFAAALAKHPGKEDTYLRGGAVTELEQKFAGMFGKEDCVFLPTGTLANNLAVRILCGEHKHLITQADSHLYADESDGPSILSGITMQPVAPGKGAPSFEEFEAAVNDAEHRAYPLKVGAVSMESPVRRHNGESIPFSTVEKVCAMAKSKGIGMHWDGARAFMLLGTPGFDLARYAAPFDTVFASLYKALHAPFGGMLMGTKEKMAEARDLRHVFGGLIYHGWVAALPALNAVDGISERWGRSRAAAEEVLAKLQAAGGFGVERVQHESNIVLLRPSEARVKGLQERLVAADIRIAPIRNGVSTFFINETVLRRTPEEIVKAFVG